MAVETTALTGKRIVLTGGTTGMGRATLALLASEGARILTFGRHREPLDEAIALTEAHTRATGVVADAATPEGIDSVFTAADAELGGVDMLVTCAALGAQPIHEMADADWRYVIDTNLVGTLACAKAAIARMERQGGGHLLFVGSISTEIKAKGESVYAATKAGIQAFAETLRKEVASKNIKVSVIQPGSVDTDMQECSDEEKAEAVARAEMLHAEEIAEAIRFVLTRSAASDVVNLRIEPLVQKTS
ncbi:SDR family NAD(P)-dependent oxidoreductase [Sphingomonas sp. ABOLD]|uniref:NADP-dependent 3-hydroxy acid dehydrogenase YdfG n=1 Tax=Sphingomonas trueperi TaxID=53317 RepID=A0A7X5Y2N7_9SPHN|nr:MULTISPECIES: SDR family oxidoreductase [Sphingomonas]NJB99914.1 NADP-dependent 3-hydroxy acid dehydrogenase YdfG [Sphingomonas trueperi]RSV40386.1 SDR family NAD(P)-dependent oxidoreductase [Sphingomonas sp. ABOLD]